VEWRLATALPNRHARGVQDHEVVGRRIVQTACHTCCTGSEHAKAVLLVVMIGALVLLIDQAREAREIDFESSPQIVNAQ
jgi:hypothetical protein